MNRLNSIRVAVGMIVVGVILLIVSTVIRNFSEYEYIVSLITFIGSICSVFGLLTLLLLLHKDMSIWFDVDMLEAKGSQADELLIEIFLYQEALKRVALRSINISPEAVEKKIKELEESGWKS